jgi:tetratricopeptide (TPR) repeat protein
VDSSDGYAKARELALTGRYREARDALKAILGADPSHVEALILLGKVEHYLRHRASSRRCFEVALSYDPNNIAAFLGVEHYRQSMRSLLLIASIAFIVIAIGAAVIFLSDRISSSSRRLEARLEGAVNALSLSVENVAGAIEETGEVSVEQRSDMEKALSGIRAELVKLRSADASLIRKIDELRDTLSISPHE